MEHVNEPESLSLYVAVCNDIADEKFLDELGAK